MLLNGKCSWSYKSVKIDDNIKKNEKDTKSLYAKGSFTHTNDANTSSALFSENSPEVYDFESFFDKKTARKKICKKKSSELADIDKDDFCYDYNEISKRTKKGRQKTTKNSKNIQNSHETPRTAKGLRNKKRVNYADLNESDLDEDGVIKTKLESSNSNISSDDDDGLIFQTRYSDNSTNILEIANTIESDSNDIFEHFEDRNKTTTSPTILKLSEKLTIKPTEQTSSDSQTMSFGDSPHRNIENELEKPESQSESENVFCNSPEVGSTETDEKCPTPEELNKNIDIGAEIFEKCQKVCSEIHTKYNDSKYKLEKPFDELKNLTVRNKRKIKVIDTRESNHQSNHDNRKKLITENTCEMRNLNRSFDKWNEILPNNKTIERKIVDQIFSIESSSSSSDFDKKRLEVKITEKDKQSDLGSEITSDYGKIQISENDLQQNTEIKEVMSVKNLIQRQSSSEENNQTLLNKEKLIKKIGLSLNWDTNLDIENESNTSTSSFDLKETRIEKFSKKSLDIDNVISKTNSEFSMYYPDTSSNYMAESDTTTENEGRTYTFQNQKFEKTKNVISNNDAFRLIRDGNSDYINIKNDPNIHANKMEIRSKNYSFNHQSKIKQVKENKKARKEKLIEESNKNSTFNTFKSADFTNKVDNKILSMSKPKTWEDLETNLLSETCSTFSKISPNPYQEIENRENFWSVEKEVEIKELTKGTFQTISKETKKSLGLKKYENNLDSNQVLSITESPNLKIINKTIQAMEKCTSRYLSPFKNDFNSNFQEDEESDLNEYSIAVHSTIIHSSRNKLSATNTFFKKTGKIDKKVEKGKKNLKNKISNDTFIEKSFNALPKVNAQKEKKVISSSKQPITYTKRNTRQMKKDLQKIVDENPDNSKDFNFDIDNYSDTEDMVTLYNPKKKNNSKTEDICTLYNPIISSYEMNFNEIEKTFHQQETEAESCYSFRKRKIKPTLENQSKKIKTKSFSPVIDLQNMCSDKDYALQGSDCNGLAKAHTNGKDIVKNNLETSINLDKKAKSKNADSGTGSNISFNFKEDIENLCDKIDIESNAVKEKPKKAKSLKKNQDNLVIQPSSSNLEAKVNDKNDLKKYKSVKNLESKDETYQIAENKCTTKSGFNSTPAKGKYQIKQIQKQDTREKYKDYLKKLFRSEDESNDNNIENSKEESINQIQKEGRSQNKELKLMMEVDDDLFSISSEDSEIDENGMFSDANLTQNSGLFFDVLDEKDN